MIHNPEDELFAVEPENDEAPLTAEDFTEILNTLGNIKADLHAILVSTLASQESARNLLAFFQIQNLQSMADQNPKMAWTLYRWGQGMTEQRATMTVHDLALVRNYREAYPEFTMSTWEYLALCIYQLTQNEKLLLPNQAITK